MAGRRSSASAAVAYNITQVSLRQAITPERLQGRMNAAMRWIVWGTIPLGTLTGGAIGQAVGLRAALWVGAIGGVPVVPLGAALAGTLDPRDARAGREPTPAQAELAGGLVEGAAAGPAADRLAADA